PPDGRRGLLPLIKNLSPAAHRAAGLFISVGSSGEEGDYLGPEPGEEALLGGGGLVGAACFGQLYALRGDDELDGVRLAVALVEEGLGRVLAVLIAGAEQAVELVGDGLRLLIEGGGAVGEAGGPARQAVDAVLNA